METKISPQAQLVLDYMKSGRLMTPMVAMISLAVSSLTARVAELRRAGYEIEDKWDKDHHNRRYKTYWLKGVPRNGVGESPKG